MVFTDAVLDVWREASNQCANLPRTGLPSELVLSPSPSVTSPHPRRLRKVGNLLLVDQNERANSGPIIDRRSRRASGVLISRIS
jgi:hypothetical protein